MAQRTVSDLAQYLRYIHQMKDFIGEAWNWIVVSVALFNPTQAVIIAFFKPLAKGSIGQMFKGYIKSLGEKEIKKFGEFKMDFLQFVGTEKERLGDKFEDRYPLYGFDELLGFAKG